jgi:hypothetical protein
MTISDDELLGGPWTLMAAMPGRDWVRAGTFPSLTAAAGRIREMETYPTARVPLEAYFETEGGTDAEALSYLEHKGRRATYVVKRGTQ